MRSYGNHSYDNSDRGRVEVGATHVTIYPTGSGNAVVARILGRADNAKGEAVRLMLDRVACPSYTTRVGEWEVKGCYVTELERKVYGEEPESPGPLVPVGNLTPT